LGRSQLQRRNKRRLDKRREIPPFGAAAMHDAAVNEMEGAKKSHEVISAAIDRMTRNDGLQQVMKKHNLKVVNDGADGRWIYI
jgi:hypothetical protein